MLEKNALSPLIAVVSANIMFLTEQGQSLGKTVKSL